MESLVALNCSEASCMHFPLIHMPRSGKTFLRRH